MALDPDVKIRANMATSVLARVASQLTREAEAASPAELTSRAQLEGEVAGYVDEVAVALMLGTKPPAHVELHPVNRGVSLPEVVDQLALQLAQLQVAYAEMSHSDPAAEVSMGALHQLLGRAMGQAFKGFDEVDHGPDLPAALAWLRTSEPLSLDIVWDYSVTNYTVRPQTGEPLLLTFGNGSSDGRPQVSVGGERLEDPAAAYQLLLPKLRELPPQGDDVDDELQQWLIDALEVLRGTAPAGV